MSKQSVFFDYGVFPVLKKSVRESQLTFVIGAKGCGKTRLLQQLKVYNCGSYYNIKEIGADASIHLRDDIIRSIERGDDRLYILDDMQYASFPERFINELSLAFDDFPHSNTRVVISGGAPVAIWHWGLRAEAGNAVIINVGFYAGINYDIEKYGNSRNYLKACADEAELAQNKSSNIFTETLDAEYQTIREDLLEKVVDEIWCLKPSGLDADTVRRCLRFLHSCHLIIFPFDKEGDNVEESVTDDWRKQLEICLAYPLQRLKHLEQHRRKAGKCDD